jgi:hypothetical protein
VRLLVAALASFWRRVLARAPGSHEPSLRVSVVRRWSESVNVIAIVAVAFRS